MPASLLAEGLDVALRDRPLVAVPLLFAAGVATSLTPCIYPMIPITAGMLGGAAAGGQSRGRTVALTAAYVGGLALVYALLGLLAGLTGSIFGAVSSNPWAYFAMANLLLVAGLVMLDLAPLTLPGGIVSWASRLGGRSPGGAFTMGAASGLVAAPCGAPAFAAVLTFVAATRSAVLGLVYLLAFSLGLTALLAGVGLVSGMVTALPRPGRWMVWIKRGGGLILIGMAEYYLVKMGSVW
ncbi:MAG TPA: cytochrome c biogenesis protein CcdA [Gemmatimonadales bacterium]|nr:cytochrome c biogenesis protein CcdA [Gemmatimonadales bacterium]